MTLKGLWSRIKKTRTCWLWIGGKNYSGYGLVNLDGRDISSKKRQPKIKNPYGTSRFHRIMWEIANKKKVPKGKKVLHKCDVRACGRPSHLFIGTQKDNVRDCLEKNRHACVRKGQEYSKYRLSKEAKKYILKNYVKGKQHYPGNREALAKKFDVGTGAIARVIRMGARSC